MCPLVSFGVALIFQVIEVVRVAQKACSRAGGHIWWRKVSRVSVVPSDATLKPRSHAVLTESLTLKLSGRIVAGSG